MRTQAKHTKAYSILSVGLLALSMSACGGSTQPPPAPPPTPMASAAPSAAPIASTPAPAPTPAPTAAAPAEPPHRGPHHHPMMGMIVAELDQLSLKPEQKVVVDGIKADFDKMPEATKEAHAQLVKDLADGAAAGKLDKTKIAADQKKLTQTIESTAAKAQEDANKLHKTLDTEQRKKLVELVRAKGKEMDEHMKAEWAEHEKGGHGPMGKPGDKPPAGPAGKPGDKPPAGPAGKPGDKPPAGPAGKPGDKPEPSPAGKPGEPAKSEPGKGEHAHGDHEKGEHGHMGPHPMMGDHGRLDKLAEEIGLTAEQKEKLQGKLEAGMKGEMGKMKDHHAGMQKHMKSIADAFESEKFDAKKAGIGEHADDMVKMMTDMQIRFIEAVLSVITPEQRAKFAEHVRQQADAHE
jgi:Spy/CpxP family protein refolding chaperone